MPASWTESNKLHSSNQREQAAVDAIDEYYQNVDEGEAEKLSTEPKYFTEEVMF